MVPEYRPRERSRSPSRGGVPPIRKEDGNGEDSDEEELSDEQIREEFEGKNLLPAKRPGSLLVNCPLCPQRSPFQTPSVLRMHMAASGKKDPAQHRWVLSVWNERNYCGPSYFSK